MMFRKRSNQDAERQDSEAGYSLMEILIVVAIIGLLLALVSPRLMSQFDRSKVVAAQAQVRELKATLDIFRLDVGRYPTEAEGLSVLVAPPGGELERDLWQGPYVNDLPSDPWGNAYVYLPPSDDGRARVMSYGADGEEGGEGQDADIVSRSS